MLHAEEFSNPLLQLLHQRPVIAQPPPVKHLPDQFQELLPVADVGTAHIQRLRKGGRRAMAGKSFRGFVHFQSTSPNHVI